MLRSIVVLIISLTIHGQSIAQATKYFISFTDKSNSNYSLNHPEDFLSYKAILRRNNFNIPIQENDLPVSAFYLDSLRKLGLKILHTSKWFNGATIESHNYLLLDTLVKIKFISSIEPTYYPYENIPIEKLSKVQSNNLKSTQNDYGFANAQITTLNGQVLHENNFRGQGMEIAIIDAGFYNLPNLPAFTKLVQNNRILGTKDFVNSQSNIYATHEHGMEVASIIVGQIDNLHIGTAPEASVWLFRTEDATSEFPVEADNWIAAIELADSLGIKIINSSLGYYEFDYKDLNYTYSQLTGGQLRISKAAEIAAEKGILIINSAGNEQSNTWHHIIAPSDAKNILSVGAITQDSTITSFSSVGPSFDQRTKPDIVAIGFQNSIQTPDGNLGFGNGTSFSAPVITGLATCLWQANPQLSNIEIIDLIKQSSNNYSIPDNEMGYGIPNFKYAYSNSLSNNKTDLNNSNQLKVYPTIFKEQITIKSETPSSNKIISIIFNQLSGRFIYSQSLTIEKNINIDTSFFPSGVYLLTIFDGILYTKYKVIKQ